MPPSEELMLRPAAHRYFLPFLDDRLDPLERDAPEAARENVAEAETLGTHRRTVRKRENVVRRHVERFRIRKMQPDERIRVAHFEPQNARPRFAARARGAPQVLANLAC